MPFSASYETGAFTYKVTVPWIRVTGSGEIVPGGFDGAGDGAGTVDSRKGASKSADSEVLAMPAQTWAAGLRCATISNNMVLMNLLS